jgi:hypothetical protein
MLVAITLPRDVAPCAAHRARVLRASIEAGILAILPRLSSEDCSHKAMLAATFGAATATLSPLQFLVLRRRPVPVLRSRILDCAPA